MTRKIEFDVNKIQDKDVLDLFYQDKNIKVKLLIKKIIDNPNYKSISFKLIEHPDDIIPFIAMIAIYIA